ncbi:MAG: Ldh family oxidoreductase [Candidatus Bathyarchaeia archaeon]
MMPTFTPDQLRNISIDIFKAAGVPEDESRLVSEFLVKANLAGHDSHGVIRIIQYVNEIRKGNIVPGSSIEVVRETPSSALLNGNWGFGQVIGVKAMKMAIEKAKKNTVSVVGVYNCCHVGRLSDYTMLAAENEMIGVAMVNSRSIVAPYGGMERMLSTGPLSYAFPTEREAPFCLDIATSICAEGKVRVMLHKGEKLPHKWIIDKYGTPSNNPADLYDGGAILPFGGEVGYKGFGLGLVIEVLTAILARSGFAFSQSKRGNGVFMEAINIETFMPTDQFKREMDELIRAMKKSKPRPGFREILLPGEPEFRTEQKRLKEGIYLPERTWKEITETAAQLNVDIERYF